MGWERENGNIPIFLSFETPEQKSPPERAHLKKLVAINSKTTTSSENREAEGRQKGVYIYKYKEY